MLCVQLTNERWTDLKDDGKFSSCRESCLKVSSVCGSDAGCYRCLVFNDAGKVQSTPIQLVVG